MAICELKLLSQFIGNNNIEYIIAILDHHHTVFQRYLESKEFFLIFRTIEFSLKLLPKIREKVVR